MVNYTPKQMAVFLRRCVKHLCDDSCPWCRDVRCDEKLMSAAAELLEEVAGDD